MSKIVTTSKLNRLWKNGILPIKTKVDSLPTIQTPDTTLTISGAPADAKVTGDKLGTKFDKTKMISSYTDMMANSVSGYGVDALGVKQGFNTLNTNMNKVKTYVGSDGKLHFVDASGADTVLNFSGGITIPRLMLQINGQFTEVQFDTKKSTKLSIGNVITTNSSTASSGLSGFDAYSTKTLEGTNDLSGTWTTLHTLKNGEGVSNLNISQYNYIRLRCVSSGAFHFVILTNLSIA